MRARMLAVAVLLALGPMWGCSKKVIVRVPPKYDLTKEPGTIGLIEFGSNADASLNRLATQQFQQHLQSAQPGVRIVDLGSRTAVLEAVGFKELTPDAIRKIGARYGVGLILQGDIDFAEPKTQLKAGVSAKDLKDVAGGMQTILEGHGFAKLLEVNSGASLWSGSSWATKSLGGVSASTQSGVSVGKDGSDNPRRDLVPALMRYLTADFRATYVKKKID